MNKQNCDIEFPEEYFLKKYDSDGKLFEVIHLKGDGSFKIITDKESLHAFN